MASGSKIKRIFWPIVQRPSLEAVTCWHATAESEYEDIRRLGFRQPVAVVPNGIDVPHLPPKQVSDVRTLLFLNRIHPKKGLDILLSAWRAIQNRYSDWRLAVVGPDNDGYLAKMQKLSNELKLKRVEFLGPLYGHDKWLAYQNADLFVLPTYSENFGITVAESLAAGTPVIVSQGAPWSGLSKHGAGWWTEIGVEPLVAVLEESLSQPREVLGVMGERGRKWMKDDFSWYGVGQIMAATYSWMLEGGPVSPWLRID
jgi:glycosyltransferase involved in cell wall biosynthesis